MAKTTKIKNTPSGKQVRVAVDPTSYLKQTPVWKFRYFDWDGNWGEKAFNANLRKHIQQHLSDFETMYWSQILSASGGKSTGHGNNSHPIPVDGFKKAVQVYLDSKNLAPDELFSLRLDATTRIYGIREENCLSFLFFDPYHGNKNTRCLK